MAANLFDTINSRPVYLSTVGYKSGVYSYSHFTISNSQQTLVDYYAKSLSSSVKLIDHVSNKSVWLISDYYKSGIYDQNSFIYYGSDGTASGTKELINYHANTPSTASTKLVDTLGSRDIILFSDYYKVGVDSLNQFNYYSTDGTVAGTQKFLSYNAKTPSTASTSLVDRIGTKDIILFNDHYRVGVNHLDQFNYYSTDGTTNGTKLILSYSAKSASTASTKLIDDLGSRDVLLIKDHHQVNVFAYNTFNFYGIDGSTNGTKLLLSYDATNSNSYAKAQHLSNGHSLLQIHDGNRDIYYETDGITAHTTTLQLVGINSITDPNIY